MNGRYSGAVASKCVEHFSDLVPARSGREDLYTHVFRAVYATIAAHWFCPPHIPEHNFKAEIQGHFTLTEDGRKLPNYSARANYDDYAIGTADGNRDGRLGIKLGVLPGLAVIEAFGEPQEEMMKGRRITTKLIKQAQAELEALDGEAETGSRPSVAAQDRAHAPSEATAQQKPAIRRLALRAEDVDTMLSLMAKRGVSGTEKQVFQALVESFKTDALAVQQQQIQTVQDLTASLNWFTSRIDALEKRCEQLQQERDRLQAEQTASEELGRLQQENAQLRRELQQTQSRLEGIQKLLGGANGAAAPTQAAAQPQVTQAAATAVESPSRTARRSRGETDEKLGQIVDALIAWNTAQESPDSQLRISIPTVKALATLMGANYQPAIQQVLKERAGELEELHQRLMLGTRHNAGVFKKEEILRAIARDYLGLDNWQEVKYAG
ncbi:protelomerase family protein [Thermoleptolyngbya sp.]